jgi:hypothetical protein
MFAKFGLQRTGKPALLQDVLVCLLQIAHYICDQLCKAIEEIGPDNVVHVCTDCAASCKAAGALVMQRWDSNFQHNRSTTLARLV